MISIDSRSTLEISLGHLLVGCGLEVQNVELGCSLGSSGDVGIDPSLRASRTASRQWGR